MNRQCSKFLAGLAVAQAAALAASPVALCAPSAFESLLSVGQRYALQQEDSKAITTFRAAIAIEPENPEPYLALMEIYSRQQDSENALRLMSEALENAVLSDEQVSRLALLYELSCQTAEADIPEQTPDPIPAEVIPSSPEKQKPNSILSSVGNLLGFLTRPKEETRPAPSRPADISSVEIAGQEKSIMFSNPLLDSALRAAAGKENGDLFESDLERITELDLTACNITDLSFLATLPNLEVLNLSSNHIKYLSGIAVLSNLRELNLNYNEISNLRPLAKMDSLQALFLIGNEITDLRPLSDLTNLYTLFLSDNQITDISPLKTLTQLEDLDLQGNKITDWSAVAFLDTVKGRPIVEESTGEEQTEPEEIEIDISEITGDWTDWDVWDDGEEIDDRVQWQEPAVGEAIRKALNVSVVYPEDLAKVTSLDLSHLGISNLSDLTACTNLKTLNLSYNQISNLKPLVGLKKLATLDLSHNQIRDISPLACKDFPNLMNLNLDSNQISDLSVFFWHIAFTSLSIRNNPVSDWAPTYHLRTVAGRPAISSVYQLVIGKYTWDEAESVCEKAGGHLAVISSEEENARVANFLRLRGYQSAYIGLKGLPDRSYDRFPSRTPNRRRPHSSMPAPFPPSISWNWVTGDSYTGAPWADGYPESSDSAVYAIVCTDKTWITGAPDGGNAVFLCEIDLARTSSQAKVEYTSPEESGSSVSGSGIELSWD